MGYGYVGDVNNSISLASAYPGGRTFSMTPPAANRYRFRTNSPGELGAMNQGRNGAGYPRTVSNAATETMPAESNGFFGQPVMWWVAWLLIFVVFLWAARKFGPGGSDGRYGNILPSFYNGVFLTLYIVLILNVLKVFATKFKIPGLSELILAA